MSDTPSTAHRTAWLVVGLLMPVALLNYLDRQMLASMQKSVMDSIPTLGEATNREELWGIMLGQFKFVYAVFSLFGGYIADRFSRRLTICTSLFVWSAVTYWTGQVTTYDELLWARSLMGVSEAFYIPAALALITDFHTGDTRSRAVGLHQMAIYCGVIVGGFGGYFADNPNLGWRLAFSSCGVLGMLYALPLVMLLRDAGRSVDVRTALQPSPTGPNEAPPPSRSFLSVVWRCLLWIWNSHPVRSLRELMSNFSFLLLILYFTLPAMAGWVVRDWMPAILQKQFNITQGLAGVSATLYWQVAAILGVAAGGWLADRWMRTNERGRINVSAIGMLLIVAAIFGVGNAGTLNAAVTFLIVFGLGWGFFDCNNMPILSQIVRPQLRATGYGIMNLFSISVGGLADWGFGRLRDRQVPLSIIFGGFAALAVVSVVLVLLIRPRPDLAQQEQQP